MNKKLIWGIVIVVVLIGGYIAYASIFPTQTDQLPCSAFERCNNGLPLPPPGSSEVKNDNNPVASPNPSALTCPEGYRYWEMTKSCQVDSSQTTVIDSVSVKNEGGKFSFVIKGTNFENKFVYIKTSSNAAANIFPSDIVKVTITGDGGNQMVVGPLPVTPGKTYPVRVIADIDTFNTKGPTPADSNEILVTVPAVN